MESQNSKTSGWCRPQYVFVLVVSLALLYSVLSQNSLLPKITINLHPSAQQKARQRQSPQRRKGSLTMPKPA
jgi:hypothetical protein